MNSVLHENSMERYVRTYAGMRELEVSGEHVVPDKMQDIGLLGDTNAHIILRAKRVEAGQGSMEGDLQIAVSYIPDGPSDLSVLELQIPWQVQFQADELTERGTAVGRVWVKKAETRMINPRKILTKIQLCAEFEVYEKQTVITYHEAESDGIVQMREETAECSMVSTVCEKTFVATDEYPVPPDMVGGRIIGKNVQFRMDDVKTLTNKLIVKGSVISDVIMCASSGIPEKISFSSSFSFIAETDTERLSPNVRVSIVPTGLYYELSSNGQLLSVEVHGVCQLICFGKESVCYLSDAYSNFYECETKWDGITVYTDARTIAHREMLTGKLICRSQVAYIRFLTATVMQDTAGATVALSAFVQYENGMSDWLRGFMPVPMKSEGMLQAVRISDLYGMINGTEIEYRMQVDVEQREEAAVRLEYITEILVDEDQPKTFKHSSLMVVRADGSLWDYAKRYGSTVALMKAYNDLEEENLPQDTVVLIPRQRK